MRQSDLIILSLVLVFILSYLVINTTAIQYIIKGINYIIKAGNYTQIINVTEIMKPIPIEQAPCNTYSAVPINIETPEPLFIDSPSNSTIYLLTQDEYGSWSPPQAPTQYIYSFNGSGITIWNLKPGDYELLICSPIPINVAYRVLNHTGMGISAFYSYDQAPIITNTVVSFFNITKASILNSTGIPNGFSLQLNVYVAVNSDGAVSYHWFQDALVVSDNYYWFQGEIDVTHYIGSSQEVNYVNGLCISGCFETPMAGYLIISVKNTTSGSVVLFGYALVRLGNVTFTKPEIHWFAQYPIPNAVAHIVVVNRLGPYGWPMDAEFVIAGPGNGGGVEFKALNATLALYYFNGTSLTPFPVTYTFAVNTAEYAVNVHVTPIGQGMAELTVGPNNYEEWS